MNKHTLSNTGVKYTTTTTTAYKYMYQSLLGILEWYLTSVLMRPSPYFPFYYKAKVELSEPI